MAESLSINNSTWQISCEDILNYTLQLVVYLLAVLAQMIACLPLVQQVWGSIPGGVVNFYLKIFNLRARRSGDVHFLIARLSITVLD